jgi:MFS family permease
MRNEFKIKNNQTFKEVKMSQSKRSSKILVVVIFFLFMFLHQVDKLLIGPLTPQIMKDFQITKTQMGAVLTGALLIGTVFYPLWGYFYDKYSRAKLLSLASLIWGSTTWLSAIVRTYVPFVITRASTGIDDSAYPGLYSLIADYFKPTQRGKVYGILQLSQPLGYLGGMILALMIAPMLQWEWRTVFIATGCMGVLLSIAIYFGVKDLPRGQAEPEYEGAAEVGQYRFSMEAFMDVIKKPTMWFIFLQGFAGVFPWNVITYWFFTYLGEERGYAEGDVLMLMAPVIIILAGGYFLGGFLGDFAFKFTSKGRILVSAMGVILGAVFLYFALNTPIAERGTFFVLMCLTAIFMPLSSPNVVSTVFDITLPEVRSTAQSVEYFIENIGAASAPLIAGIIADATNLYTAILWICISAWALCFVFYLFVLFFIDKDIRSLRTTMESRVSASR